MVGQYSQTAALHRSQVTRRLEQSHQCAPGRFPLSHHPRQQGEHVQKPAGPPEVYHHLGRDRTGQPKQD